MDWLKDAVMVCVGWILGLLTLPIAKDAETREKCLRSLYELKNLLLELSRYTGFQSRSENGFYERLTKIRSLVEKIDVEKTSLAFPCYQLNCLINQSLTIFKKLDPEHENPTFHSHQSVAILIYAWDNNIHPTFEQISEIQKQISKSFFGRFWVWIHSVLVGKREFP